MSELLDRFYSALRALSATDLRECIADDFTLDWQGTDSIPWAGQWRGVQGLINFVEKLNANVEILEVQRIHTLEQDEVVVVVLRGHWRIKATELEIRAMAANLFTFSGERIRSYTVLNYTAAFAEALARQRGESAA